MRIRAERWLVGPLIAIVIVGAGFAWKHAPAEPEGQSANAVPMPAARPALSVPVQVPGAVPVSASIVDDDQPLSVQVERLLATHDPQHAYPAYFLISACTMFKRHHDLKFDDSERRVQPDMNAGERQHVTKMCNGMTERERQARLDYLAIAVKAGIAGAAWAFAAEGPFGDPSALQTRPDDPLVQAWKATATTQLAHAAEASDATTLLLGTTAPQRIPLDGQESGTWVWLRSLNGFQPSKCSARRSSIRARGYLSNERTHAFLICLTESTDCFASGTAVHRTAAAGCTFIGRHTSDGSVPSGLTLTAIDGPARHTTDR